MAKRYIGDAVVEITYRDRGDYAGAVKAGGYSWKFDELRAPAAGLPYAYDSPEAYDKMAASAVTFGSYYTTHNRGSDTPDWAPPAEVADAIAEASSWATDDQGNYEVRRGTSADHRSAAGMRDNRRLTAQPDAYGRHPRYKHLIMFELEPHHGSYILTAAGHEGDALISEDDALEMFGERGIDNGFAYLTDEYLDLLGETAACGCAPDEACDVCRSSGRKGRALDNPRRPPRLWMRDCVRGVRDSGSARDPGAVCGALWYRKMDAGQRRAALAREGKMEENPVDNPLSDGTVVVVVAGAALAVVAGLVWLATRPKKAAATLTPRAAPSATPTSSVTQATAQSAQQLHPAFAFTV
jgi:hypothetical protein